MASDRVTMTVDEVAAMLGISRNSAFRAVKSGDLPSIRIGRRILVPRERVLSLLGALSAPTEDQR
ncbi:MAG TPA: helix-turn-helix domain-containing protein [Mycobacteriales bacterium]|nr:helix-turn-helix domain-containing protein [Mycobacteriales bacterium]